MNNCYMSLFPPFTKTDWLLYSLTVIGSGILNVYWWKDKTVCRGKMGSTRKGCWTFWLPPCCGEVQGSARNTSWSKARCRRSFWLWRVWYSPVWFCWRYHLFMVIKSFLLLTITKMPLAYWFFRGWRANRTAHFFANHRKIERSHGNGAAIPLTDYYRRLVLTGA